LADFFRDQFSPARLTDKDARHVDRHEKAVSWLDFMLRRPATLSDLTPGSFRQLRELILDHGCTRLRASRITTCLERIARFARQTGAIARAKPRRLRIARPEETKKSPRPQHPRFLNEPPAADTLAAAWNLMRPELDGSQHRGRPRRRGGQRRLSRNRLNTIGAAIRQFDVFLGHYARPEDLTPERLAAFRLHTIRQGRSEAASHKRVGDLRMVARQIEPSRFPDRRRRAVDLPPPAPSSVREFFETIYVPERLLGATAEHVRHARQTLELLYQHDGRDTPIDELNDNLVAGFLNKLLERGLSRTTVNARRAMLLAVWRLAYEQQRVDRLSRIRKLRVNLDAPDSWSEDELRSIVAAPASMRWTKRIQGIPPADYYRALLLVVCQTAIRRGSLFQLSPADVDLEASILTVRAQNMKNRRGQRYKLGPDAIDAIRKIWDPHRPRLFPVPSVKQFHYDLRRIITVAGLAPSPRSTCNMTHKLRRSVATILAARRGIPAASHLLGHASVQVTMRHYVDTSRLPEQNLAAVLPDLTTPAGGPVEASGSPAMDNDPTAALAEARQLFALGFVAGAARAARVAIQAWLIGLGRLHSVKGRSLGEYPIALRSHGVIDGSTQERVKQYLGTCNAAAHGRAVNTAVVGELLGDLAQLVAGQASP
jgi:integrase